MEVWKAKLSLFRDSDNEWASKFTFELHQGDYKYEEYNGWELHSKGKIIDRIPECMLKADRYQRGYSDIEIIQGFKKELSNDKLKLLEFKMRERMRRILDEEMTEYMKNYTQKIVKI